MSATTLCPTCNTRFKVTQAQLDTHQGLVRCGRCQAVFNATEYLQDDQPSPQPDLPIAAEAIRQEASVESAAEPAPATHEESDFSLDEADRPEQPDAEQKDTEQKDTEQKDTEQKDTERQDTERQDTERQDTERQDAERQDAERQDAEQQDKIELAEPITLAQKIAFADSPDARPQKPVKKKSFWPWIAGSLLLLIVLLAQAAYFFRVELAANQPGLKPALISYCRLLLCTVPLPQKADLMSIESSDLEADPAQSSVIVLNALLRNRAPHAQAYPLLELTLTDAQDKALARRTFHPAEYLKPDEDEKQGFAANREFSVKLNLDTTDLKPSGYRLFLFYPQ